MMTRAKLCITVFVVAAQLNAPAAAIPTLGPGGGALSKAIPGSQVGAVAGMQYSGEGLNVTPTEPGAQLHCAFQRLDGLATREGLWLTSTVQGQPNDCFRVKTVAVVCEGRAGSPLRADRALSTPNPPGDERFMLPTGGQISVQDETVRFTRPGLVEEYSVSMDGVRQDFFVLENPGVRVPETGLACDLEPLSRAELRVELSVTGARVEQTAYGAKLVLEHSGRKVAYSRLRVTDANGKELPARMEVAGDRGIQGTNPPRQPLFRLFRVFRGQRFGGSIG